MSADLPPLPPDIAELLRRERGAEPPPHEARARVRERVQASVALAGAAATPLALHATGKAAAAVKPLLAGLAAKLGVALAVSALGVAAYVGWRAAHRAPTPRPEIRTRAPIAVPAVPTPPPVLTPTPAPVLTPAPAAIAPLALTLTPSAPKFVAPPASPPAHVRHHETDEASHLTEERVLLEAARTALAGGDPGAALASIDRHARRFPLGQLSEERECLRIRALVASGDEAAANRRAAAFAQRYPHSLFQLSACRDGSR